MLENPQIFQHCKFKNIFSAEHGQSAAEAILNRAVPGITPSVKPCGFASSLGEGASGETGYFAFKPECLPPCQRPHLRGGWLRPTGADWGSFSRHPLSHGMRRASSPKGTPMALPQSLPLCRERARPLRHRCAMPPLPKGEALAVRQSFRFCQGLPLWGSWRVSA